MAYGYYAWRPYVPVHERRRNAERAAAKLAKKGHRVSPVRIAGRQIAGTFWGKAWCDNLESYSDFANRLPRGRTYVRNGAVFDLQIGTGTVEAQVSGSEIYEVRVRVKSLTPRRWKAVIRECAGKIGSLIELLQGRVSESVLAILARPRDGLFPAPSEMNFTCSCPDWADMCKHVAAALYGVGARLDEKPELFFTLRGVDQKELVGSAAVNEWVGKQRAGSKAKRLAASAVPAVFGIEIDTQPRRRRRAGAGGARPAHKSASQGRSE